MPDDPQTPAQPPAPPEFTTSESIDKILPALIDFQSELTPAKRDAENPHFQTTYADLCAVMAVARPLMGKNRLALVAIPAQSVNDAGVIIVTTRLYHESGQWMQCRLRIALERPTAQGIGSAITYARRYSAMSLLWIVAEGDDDDGNRASEQARQGRQQQQGRPQQQQGRQQSQGRPQQQRQQQKPTERIKRDDPEAIQKAASEAMTLLDDAAVERFGQIGNAILKAETIEGLQTLKADLMGQDDQGQPKSEERKLVDSRLYTALRPQFTKRYSELLEIQKAREAEEAAAGQDQPAA